MTGVKSEKKDIHSIGYLFISDIITIANTKFADLTFEDPLMTKKIQM